MGHKPLYMVLRIQINKMTDLQTYAQRLNIPVGKIMSRSRKPELTTARQVYWYHLHRHGYGNSQIGRIFNRNHATVQFGIRQIQNLMDIQDSYINRFLEAVK